MFISEGYFSIGDVTVYAEFADPVVRYVKSGGTGGGSSWASASNDLQAEYPPREPMRWSVLEFGIADILDNILNSHGIMNTLKKECRPCLYRKTR
jgi:hypothetical protein